MERRNRYNSKSKITTNQFYRHKFIKKFFFKALPLSVISIQFLSFLKLFHISYSPFLTRSLVFRDVARSYLSKVFKVFGVGNVTCNFYSFLNSDHMCNCSIEIIWINSNLGHIKIETFYHEN